MKARTWLLFFASLGACNTDTFDGDDGGDASSDSRDEIPAIGGGDGSTDAKKDSDSSVTPIPRFCDSVDASFCADFDIPNDAGAGFGTPTALAPYSVSFEQSDTKTKPTSLEVDIPADANNGVAYVEALPPGTAATTMSLDLEIKLPVAAPGPAIFAFAFGVPAPDSSRYGIAQLAGAWALMNLTSGKTGNFSSAITTGTWVHAQIVVTLGAAGNVVAVVDGKTATIPVTDTTGVDGGLSDYPSRLGLGVVRPNTLPPAGPQLVLYDNVVVTLK